MTAHDSSGRRTMTKADELKSSGLKATLPRIKILEVFQHAQQRHMTAEDVFRLLLAEGSDIGLATVYRVLMQFEQAGILSRNHFESGNVGVRAQRRQAPRPPGVPRLRPRRGVLRRRDRDSASRLVAQTRGFELQEHSLALYAACTKKNCPYRPKRLSAAARCRRSSRAGLARLVLAHRALVALDELAVGVDAAQLQDRVAHRGLDQHREVAAGVDRDDRPCAPARRGSPRTAARTAGARTRAPASPCAPGARSASGASSGAPPSRRRWP